MSQLEADVQAAHAVPGGQAVAILERSAWKALGLQDFRVQVLVG